MQKNPASYLTFSGSLESERNSGGRGETVTIGVRCRSIIVNLENRELEIKPANDRHCPVGVSADQIVVLPF